MALRDPASQLFWPVILAQCEEDFLSVSVRLTRSSPLVERAMRLFGMGLSPFRSAGMNVALTPECTHGQSGSVIVMVMVKPAP